MSSPSCLKNPCCSANSMNELFQKPRCAPATLGVSAPAPPAETAASMPMKNASILRMTRPPFVAHGFMVPALARSRNLCGGKMLVARQHDRRRSAMLFGRHLSDQELLARLYQATLKLDETSAHARRRLREAQICLRQMQHAESPPPGDTARKRAS